MSTTQTATSSLIGVVLAGLLGLTQAEATTYTYIGQDLSNGGHVTAFVDLNCGGPCTAGQYIEGGSLTSFSLTAYDSSNNQVFTFSSTDLGYSNLGFVNYLILNNAGSVTNWFLLALDNGYGPIGNYAYTIGNDLFPPSNCNPSVGCSTQDLWNLDFFNGSNNHTNFSSDGSTAGVWDNPTLAATPIPATLPLFASGFAGLGLIGWRSKRKRKLAA
jgi:hypothetical protein